MSVQTKDPSMSLFEPLQLVTSVLEALRKMSSKIALALVDLAQVLDTWLKMLHLIFYHGL